MGIFKKSVKKVSKELELPPELPTFDLEEEVDLGTGEPTKKKSVVESPKKAVESEVKDQVRIGDGLSETNLRLYEVVVSLQQTNALLEALLVKVSEQENQE